jgi:O-antigen/teichoic acid export membrane protein
MKKVIILYTIVYLELFVQPAFAYIDPGTGSAIISLVIGFFVAIGVFVKSFWYKIKKLFRLSKNKKIDIKK